MTYNDNNNFVTDARMTSVDEEIVGDSHLLSTNDKLKDPRVCNERSDSGFSECSNCSTPSASCLCNLTQIDKSDTIVEEQFSSSTAEPNEESQSESRSEISSLEYDDANKGNCDNSSQNEEEVVLSIRVPTRRELFQNEFGVPMSEIERRKVSLENETIKKSKSGAVVREEFSLEKLKKASKVALLMEKFEATPPAASSANFKFKAVVTNDNDDDGDEGLIKSTPPNLPNSVPSITNNVKICDLTKEPSINAGHETNHDSTTHSLVALSPAATRKSPTNHTTTFRLSDRVREATERLSKPKQQVSAAPTSMDKATKASILTKQNSNFARSKEFWKR